MKGPLSIVVLLLSLPALAGCLSGTNSEAVILIDYGGAQRHGVDERVAASVAFDVDERTTRDLYESRNFRHPDYFTAHDLLAKWVDETDTQAEWKFFAGLGFAVISIDFVRCNFDLGDQCFWQLIVNGEPAEVGMSSLRVDDGDLIEWIHTPF